LKSDYRPFQTKDTAPDINLYAPDVLVYLLTLAGEKVVQISDTTKAQLQAALAAGVQAGESILQIAKRIDSLYLDQIIPNRSVTIAATEVIAASNYGSQEAATQSELALNKVWLATEDAHTRQTHRDADGQEVGLDEPFEVGDSQLMFPGDSSLGADASEIVRCRCTQYYKRIETPAEDDVNKSLAAYIYSLPGQTVTREQYRELLRMQK
jgi:hypothetical protein